MCAPSPSLPHRTDLCHSPLNIPGVSGGHGLQGNAMLAANLDLSNLQWFNYSIIMNGSVHKSGFDPLTWMVLVGRRFVVDTDSQYLIASVGGAATD